VSHGVGDIFDIWRVDTGASSGVAGGPREALEIVGEGDACQVGQRATQILCVCLMYYDYVHCALLSSACLGPLGAVCRLAQIASSAERPWLSRPPNSQIPRCRRFTCSSSRLRGSPQEPFPGPPQGGRIVARRKECASRRAHARPLWTLRQSAGWPPGSERARWLTKANVAESSSAR
jgi:hypothetical protein